MYDRALSMFKELGFTLYNLGKDFLLYAYETEYDKCILRLNASKMQQSIFDFL